MAACRECEQAAAMFRLRWTDERRRVWIGPMPPAPDGLCLACADLVVLKLHALGREVERLAVER